MRTTDELTRIAHWSELLIRERGDTLWSDRERAFVEMAHLALEKVVEEAG